MGGSAGRPWSTTKGIRVLLPDPTSSARKASSQVPSSPEVVTNGRPLAPEALRRLGCEQLADGMTVFALPHFPDDRGSLTEICRGSWLGEVAPVQWNCVRSKADVMRGMHVHLRYYEYYAVMSGSLMVGFQDTREGSPTLGLTGVFTVRAEDRLAVSAAPGIVHGLYFPDETILLAGAGHYFNLENELGCHWKDPALNIAWPFTEAIVSARDDAHPLLAEIQPSIPRWGL